VLDMCGVRIADDAGTGVARIIFNRPVTQHIEKLLKLLELSKDAFPMQETSAVEDVGVNQKLVEAPQNTEENASGISDPPRDKNLKSIPPELPLQARAIKRCASPNRERLPQSS
jgi:hypothetical protein